MIFVHWFRYSEPKNGEYSRGAAPWTYRKFWTELRQEREQLEEAILSLGATGPRARPARGRPPAWMAEAKKRGRPLGSKNKIVGEAKTAVAGRTSTAAA